MSAKLDERCPVCGIAGGVIEGISPTVRRTCTNENCAVDSYLVRIEKKNTREVKKVSEA